MRFLAACLSIVLALCSVGVVTLVSAPVWAQDADIERLLNSAIENYDILEIDEARDKIEQAIDLAVDSNINAGPLLGKLYIMRGVIEYAASGDEDAVQEIFRKAVVAESTMDVPGVYRTPDLEAILARARETVGTTAPDRVPSSAGITHNALTDVDARKAVVFEAFVPRDMPVYKMFVYFRIMGEDAWKKVEMQPTNAERFAVQVQGNEFYASQFDYYIVAEDRGGNAVGTSASESAPHNAVVLGSGDVTKPDEPDPDKPPREPRDPSDTIMYIAAMFGTSPGLLTGAENNTPTAHPDRDVSPGLAIGFGHFALDVGATLTPKMYLGLFFRFQFAPAQPFEGLPPTTTTGGSGFWNTQAECLGLGLPGDCILGLKYRLFINDNQKFRLFSTVGIGVGRVRNWLRLKQQTAPNNPTGQALCANKKTFVGTTGSGDTVEFCYIRDTVRTGWLHFGAGGGAAIHINDFTDIILDSYLMVLAPVTSVNLDLSGGLMFKF